MSKYFFIGLRKKPKMKDWWFLCAVVPSQERKFISEVSRAGIYCYSPVETDQKVVRGQFVVVHHRFLKGYVFIPGKDLGKFLAKNDWKGFLSVFTNNDEFCKIDDRIIQELIRRQLANEFDKRAHTPPVVGDLVYIEDQELGKIMEAYQFILLSVQRKNAVIAQGNRELKVPLAKLRKVTL